MSKAFDPIKTAGEKGDITKAKEAYNKVIHQIIFPCAMQTILRSLISCILLF
jgi:hypothetical protein